MNGTATDLVARFAYANGEPPLVVAEARVAGVLDVRDTIRDRRRREPRAFPGVWADVSSDATARHLVDLFVDLGWSPPSSLTDAAVVEALVDSCREPPARRRRWWLRW